MPRTRGSRGRDARACPPSRWRAASTSTTRRSPGTDKHVSLGLTVPVGARAAVAVTSAERERAAAERARLVRSIEAEIVATWNRTEAARQRLAALDAATLPAAREAAELAGIAYREGRLDLLRLLESERALLDAGVSRVETWVLWGTERASLERLVGGRL